MPSTGFEMTLGVAPDRVCKLPTKDLSESTEHSESYEELNIAQGP